jgi:hypothetical protein
VNIRSLLGATALAGTLLAPTQAHAQTQPAWYEQCTVESTLHNVTAAYFTYETPQGKAAAGSYCTDAIATGYWYGISNASVLGEHDPNWPRDCSFFIYNGMGAVDINYAVNDPDAQNFANRQCNGFTDQGQVQRG